MADQYNQQYQEELYKQILQKIKTEWRAHFTKYGSEFTGLETISNKDGFVRSVIQRVETILLTQVGPIRTKEIGIPSKDFFKRIFFDNNPETRWQEPKRQALSIYAGFGSWEEFVCACDAATLPVTVFESAEMPVKPYSPPTLSDAETQPDAPIEKPNVQSKPLITNKFIWPVVSILLLLAGLGGWAWFSSSDGQASRFRQCIDEANKQEFALYEAVPTADTSMLTQYFTRSGSAKRIIIGGLQRAIRQNRRLRVPPSAYMLVNFTLKRADQLDAYIETDEQWYLLWYDAETNRDTLLFDTLNHHQYWLRMEDGRWKIHMDEYRGRPQKVVH